MRDLKGRFFRSKVASFKGYVKVLMATDKAVFFREYPEMTERSRNRDAFEKHYVEIDDGKRYFKFVNFGWVNYRELFEVFDTIDSEPTMLKKEEIVDLEIYLNGIRLREMFENGHDSYYRPDGVAVTSIDKRPLYVRYCPDKKAYILSELKPKYDKMVLAFESPDLAEYFIEMANRMKRGVTV